MKRHHIWLALLPIAILMTMLGSFSTGVSNIHAQGPTRDPCRDEFGEEICPHYNSFDDRVNYLDPLATITAYCRPDRSLDVWIITNTQGQYAWTASEAQMSNALGQAINTGQQVIVGEALAMQLWALPSNQLMLRDGRNGNEFRFSPALCGVSANLSFAPPQPTAVPLPTEVPAIQLPATATPNVTIIIVPNGDLPAATAESVESSSSLSANIPLNLRAAPSFASRRLAIVPVAAPLVLLGRNTDGTWLFVEFEGQQGWVWSPLASVANEVISGLAIMSAN